MGQGSALVGVALPAHDELGAGRTGLLGEFFYAVEIGVCVAGGGELRHRDLRAVRAVGHSEVLRLLAKRNTDIGDRRTQVVSRLHSLLVELAPGGIAKEINASDVVAFLAGVSPGDPVAQTRYDLAVELLDEIRKLDAQLKASHRRIRAAIAASATTMTDIFGIGPIIAAMLIGYTGDIARFRDRDHYAAYNGTAPVEFSSGGRTVHRLSTRGNR